MRRAVNRSVAGATLAIAIMLLAVPGPAAARRERLALRHVTLDLPGPPAKVIPTDLNGDGRDDLLVVVAYTEVEEVGQDRIEGMIQITTVIPTAFDRREVRAYLATPDGGYRAAGDALRLSTSTLHLEPGPEALGVIALTDDGLSRLRFDSAREPPTLDLEPILARPPVLAGIGSFFASLTLVHDLNGDGTKDLLLPAPDALLVYLGTPSGLTAEPVDRIDVPSDVGRDGGEIQRHYPLPDVRDVSGDGIADLVFSSDLGPESPARIHILLGTTQGSFRPLRGEALDCHDRLTDLRFAVSDPESYPWPRNLVTIRDLDGDGLGETVFAVDQPRGDSFRKEMKDAKRPLYVYSFHHMTDGLFIAPAPYHETQVVGHSMGDEDPDGEFPLSIRQFQDLDGDGRKDLVTLTLDFSIFQALKILATKKIGIRLDFHVYAQNQDGGFDEVPDLDLSEKLKFDLNNLKLGRFAQFAGDFDGDGRQDFAHLGRGKIVTLHAGRPGCGYPKDPDLSIKLEEEPASLDLVRIEDLDGDGRADLRITRPLTSTDPDTTAPVRLDLYLSGDGS